MSSNSQVPDPEVPAKARTRSFSAAYKARMLAEYETLDKAGKGALLRREGLSKPVGRPQADPRGRANALLRKENDRLRADLDKARRVIEVQGKLALPV